MLPSNPAIAFEDYLVARVRFLRSKKRNSTPDPKHPSKMRCNTQAPDVKTHGDALRSTILLLMRAPKESGIHHTDNGFVMDGEAGQMALRIARRRLKNDKLHGQCQCASSSCDRGF